MRSYILIVPMFLLAIACGGGGNSEAPVAEANVVKEVKIVYPIPNKEGLYYAYKAEVDGFSKMPRQVSKVDLAITNTGFWTLVLRSNMFSGAQQNITMNSENNKDTQAFISNFSYSTRDNEIVLIFNFQIDPATKGHVYQVNIGLIRAGNDQNMIGNWALDVSKSKLTAFGVTKDLGFVVVSQKLKIEANSLSEEKELFGYGGLVQTQTYTGSYRNGYLVERYDTETCVGIYTLSNNNNTMSFKTYYDTNNEIQEYVFNRYIPNALGL